MYLKWCLIFEEPITHTLMLARATPRVWLEEGEVLSIINAPTAYGRVGMKVVSAIRSNRSVHVNLTLPAEWQRSTGAPPGGIVLTLRAPGGRRAIRGVTVGGKKWSAFNATAGSVACNEPCLRSPGMVGRLADVWVVF